MRARISAKLAAAAEDDIEAYTARQDGHGLERLMEAATRPELDIRADFPILATTTSRGKRLVYLDSAASSQKPAP